VPGFMVLTLLAFVLLEHLDCRLDPEGPAAPWIDSFESWPGVFLIVHANNALEPASSSIHGEWFDLASMWPDYLIQK
jgi:hypothetical protein